MAPRGYTCTAFTAALVMLAALALAHRTAASATPISGNYVLTGPLSVGSRSLLKKSAASPDASQSDSPPSSDSSPESDSPPSPDFNAPPPPDPSSAASPSSSSFTPSDPSAASPSGGLSGGGSGGGSSAGPVSSPGSGILGAPAAGPLSGDCPSFWKTNFNNAVNTALGKSDALDCNGDPGAGDNAAMASQIKEADRNENAGLTWSGDLWWHIDWCLQSQLDSSGCGEFEALVWDGTHGHDHQGANVITYQNGCDGGMSGNPPGDNCQNVGGTYHGFCTGAGKSYAVFIKPPNSSGSGGSQVASLAEGCKDKADLLIEFTKCVQKGSNGLKGVIAVPTQGIPGRPNHYATTSGCSPDGWLSCNVLTLNGRQLTIFAVS